jgi:Cu-Zn family superoxide dismutase
VTDSHRPILFVVPPTAEPGDMDAMIRFDGSPVRYQQGFNLNGIVITEDGSSLIVVQSNTGMLFRIEVADGSITPIEVEADLTNGDGLVLDGQMLYVVRNRQEEIVPVELSEDLSSGTAREAITSDALKFPTTAALVDGSLLVVNSQFGAQGTADVELPFSVVRVALPD